MDSKYISCSMGTVSSITHSSELLFTIPVVDVLAWFGKRVDHRGYMYYSPFREESEPSMRVTVNSADGTWIWADYGNVASSGKKVDGGGCLEMVRRLGGFSSSRDAFEELKRIAASRGMNVIEEEVRQARRQAGAKPSGIVVDRVSAEFTRSNLVSYAKKRGIPAELLNHYCSQVTYHAVSDVNRQYTVIGFRNDAGGFALRGTGPSKISKRNTVSGITTISFDGKHIDNAPAASSKCALFEGFMDFLSYMAWKGSVEPGIDACVLNSTSIVGRAKEWVEQHDAVRTFFDNDKAGERATREVEAWCRALGKDFKDGRAALGGHNDLNEAWTAELDRRRAQHNMLEMTVRESQSNSIKRR